MAKGSGISGVAVAMAGVGALLVYVGVRNVPLRQGVASIAGGTLPTPQAGAGDALAQAEAALGSSGATTTKGSTAGVSGGTHPEIAVAALRYQGVPYVWGGSTPAGFDCSGLVWYVLSHDLGVKGVPRTTYTQQPWSQLKTISRSEVGAGDLVFWPGHVAIAINTTTVVHAPRPGSDVHTAPINQAGPVGTSPTFKRFIGTTNAGA